MRFQQKSNIYKQVANELTVISKDLRFGATRVRTFWRSRSSDMDAATLLTQILDLAAKHGNISVVRWVLANFPHSRISSMAFDDVSERGYLEIVKLFCAHSPAASPTSDGITNALVNGFIETYSYLSKHRKTLLCREYTIDEMIRSNSDLSIIKSIVASRPEVKISPRTLVAAIDVERTDIINWLHAKHSSDITRTC